MTPERWEQINRLYLAALEVAEQERSSFLYQACADDGELRAEVESLLALHGEAGDFLGKPAIQEVAYEIRNDPPSLVGRQLGPYRVLGVIGAGGMGEVYKARDTRLKRTVAIKLLPWRRQRGESPKVESGPWWDGRWGFIRFFRSWAQAGWVRCIRRRTRG